MGVGHLLYLTYRSFPCSRSDTTPPVHLCVCGLKLFVEPSGQHFCSSPSMIIACTLPPQQIWVLGSYNLAPQKLSVGSRYMGTPLAAHT